MTSEATANARGGASRRAAAVVLAVLLAGAMLLVPPVAPAQAASSVLTLTGTSSMRLGSVATLKVRWTTSGKATTGTVALQAYSTGHWTTIRSVKVSKGKATVKVPTTVSRTYRLLVGKKKSANKRVTVIRSWVSFSFGKDLSTSIKAGDAASAQITLFKNGARAAGSAAVQSKAGGTWHTIATVAVDASGRAFVPLTPTANNWYRVVWTGIVSYERKVRVVRDWTTLAFSPSTVADSDTATTATVRWFAKGKPATGTVWLQRKQGSTWTGYRSVAVVAGTGSVALTPGVSASFRVRAGSVTSPTVPVTVTVVIPGSFTIRGSGWGHGVGMSQYGAYSMALAGRSAEQILTHYYAGTKVEAEAMPLDSKGKPVALSVQVLGPDADYGRTYDQEQTSATAVVAGGDWRLRDSAGATVYASGTSKTIKFAVVGGNVRASVGTTSVVTSSVIRLHWEGTTYFPAGGAEAYAAVNGAQGRYRHGRLTVTVIGGYINVVNDLALNTEYLYGIAEMPSSWGVKGPAALQVQAIAARSYALLKLKRGIQKDCGCHLVDDVRDQNFTGWKKENEGTDGYYGKLWKAAVDATVSGTTGAVLTYAGKPIATHYYSASGGGTLNSEDVWASVVPWERSVDDAWSLKKASGNPNIVWTAKLTQANARKMFALPDVVRVSVSARYPGGGLKTLTATASDGTTASITGKSDRMRSKLNSWATGEVKAAWVTSITGDPAD